MYTTNLQTCFKDSSKKASHLFLLLAAIAFFCQCNFSPKQKITSTVKTDTIPKKEVTIDSLYHGLTTDLDYEKYDKDQLLPIIQAFRQINGTTSWVNVKEVNLESPGEGGTAIFYFDKTGLRKIVSTQYREMGKTVSEYYLDKSMLVFTYESAYTYNRPIYWDSTAMKEGADTEVFDMAKAEIDQSRSYFKNGVLLHQSNDQDCGAPFDAAYLKEEATRIKKDFSDLKKAVTGKQ